MAQMPQNELTLDDVYATFNVEVGHVPNTQAQLLAFCKQKKYPFKFKDIRQYWPNRYIVDFHIYHCHKHIQIRIILFVDN